jgi:hypothetical protein
VRAAEKALADGRASMTATNEEVIRASRQLPEPDSNLPLRENLRELPVGFAKYSLMATLLEQIAKKDYSAAASAMALQAGLPAGEHLLKRWWLKQMAVNAETTRLLSDLGVAYTQRQAQIPDGLTDHLYPTMLDEKNHQVGKPDKNQKQTFNNLNQKSSEPHFSQRLLTEYGALKPVVVIRKRAVTL